MMEPKPQPGHGTVQKTLLVVDDEELMLRLLEKSFSRFGYRVLSARDGERAIELYRSHQNAIDAVLLDSRLPKISGGEVFRLMKAENAAVKVVMTSGYMEPAEKDELDRAGVVRLVSKPYNLREMRELFESLLQET